MRILDLFSAVGCHSIGFSRAGLTRCVGMVEINSYRRAVLRKRFPGIEIHDDVRTYEPPKSEIVFGGPPCQETSVGAAISGKRSGRSLWGEMFRIGVGSSAKWIVVEQPPGNAAWETKVCDDLSGAGFHVAKIEFGACDIGAPYLRRRVFLVACTSLPRLEIAWKEAPRAIERVKRSADARGSWNPDKLGALRVDARSAGEMDRGRSRQRRERIEALGDSNPPEMAEVIGRCLVAAN